MTSAGTASASPLAFTQWPSPPSPLSAQVSAALLLSGVFCSAASQQYFTSVHRFHATSTTASLYPLLEALEVDETAFKSRLAVDAAVGGSGHFTDSTVQKHDGSGFRANRGLFEEMLREDLDIRYAHHL
jgi:hypothetical protein